MAAKHVAARVFKVLFILFLVVAVLTSAVYFLVAGSMSAAERNGTVPSLFGTSYVPMMREGAFESINAGSVVLIDDNAYVNDVLPGTVILYQTPADSDVNEVMPGLSLGTVQVLNQAEDGTVSFQVKAGETAEDLQEISAESLIGTGSWTLNGLGNALEFVNSTTGLIVLVVIPGAIFVISLVLFLVLRPKRGEVEDLEEYEEDEDEEEEELYTEKTPVRLKEERAAALPASDITRRTVSSATAGEIVPEKEEEIPVVSESLMNEFLREEEAAPTPEPEQNVEEDDLVESLLKDLETPELKDADHTMEFDLAKLQEQILNDTATEQSSEILNDLDKQIAELKEPEDAIKFLLHENSIDVNFRDIISMDIEIENHPDGSGFTVKTPNYTASINISISKNK